MLFQVDNMSNQTMFVMDILHDLHNDMHEWEQMKQSGELCTDDLAKFLIQAVGINNGDVYPNIIMNIIMQSTEGGVFRDISITINVLDSPALAQTVSIGMYDDDNRARTVHKVIKKTVLKNVIYDVFRDVLLNTADGIHQQLLHDLDTNTGE